MYTKRGSNAVTSDTSIAVILKDFFCMKAYADEESQGEQTPVDESGNEATNTGSHINIEDLMTKVRNEEKKKQYGTIERLKQQNTKLTEQHNDDLLKIAGLEKDVEDAKSKLTQVGNGDSEEIKTLKKEIETLTAERDSLAKKVKDIEDNPAPSRDEIEAEVRQALEAEYEVKEYKLKVLAEHKDDLLVPELVMGDTKEAIDASLATALERSNQIKQSLGFTKQGTPDKRRTPKSSANPSVQSGSGDDIATLNSLDIHSKEYAEVRRQLGLS